MKAEIRADGLHISGYVNVPGRASRPVMTSRGRVIETIEQGAFRGAIERAEEIRMLRDHDWSQILAGTQENTLTVQEDAVGLRAEAVIVDPKTIEDARAGKIRGWSFSMRNIKDDVEQRADDLPLRTVHSFDMDEISLIIDRIPVYSSTSIEVRSEGDESGIEIRSDSDDVELLVKEAKPEEKPEETPADEWRAELDAMKTRIEKLKTTSK